MTRISSSFTVFHKKVFPAMWFGFLALFFVTTTLSRAVEKNLMFLVLPVLMAVFGYCLMKKLLWDLVDEVYDCGDFLLIRNRGEEDTIALSNVMNVSATMFMNPARVTLRLVNPSKFGTEIVFSPMTGFRLNPFAKNQVVEDLVMRVDQARSKRAA